VQGAALMILHHSGKDSAKGMRGSSALLGAVDTELELIRFEDSMKGIIRTAKQKDGEDGTRTGFEMVKVELAAPAGSLQIGEPMTSLAVQASKIGEHEDKKNKGKSGSKLTGQQLKALTCIENVVKQKGILKFIEGSQRMCVLLTDWEVEFRAKLGSKPSGDKTFDKAWDRAKEALETHKLIDMRGDWVWMLNKTAGSEPF
jgi:hypothetical protein